MASTSWKTAANGDWTTPGDWTSGVPASNVDATIGIAGTYTVTLATAEVDAANSLDISNTTATVALAGAAKLTIGTTLTNDGTLDVDSTAADGGATLTAVTLTNSGTATFGNGTAASAVTVDLATLNNNASGTVDLLGGSGGATTVTVTSAVTNDGILSVGADSTLDLTNRTFTQSGAGASTTVAGTLKAASLTLDGGTFHDTGSFTFGLGTITVSAATATFSALSNLSGGTLTGGTFKVEAGGILNLPSVTTLDATVDLIGATASASSLGSNLTTIDTNGVLNIESGQNFAVAHALTVDAAPGTSKASTLIIDSTSALTDSLGVTINSSGFATDAGALETSVTVNGTLTLAPTFTLGSGDSITGTGTLELGTGTGHGTITLVHSGTGIDVSNVTVASGATWTVSLDPTTALPTTLTGNGADSTLDFTAAGTFSLSGVTKFDTINLFGGTNDVTLSGPLNAGAVTINGGTGPDTIDASAVTSGSLTFNAGATSTGDSFTGGAEGDIVKGVAAALNTDTLIGGGGNNAIVLTGSTGVANLTGASQFQTIDLSGSNTTGGNTVTIGDSEFKSGTAVENVTVNGSASTTTGFTDHVTSTATALASEKQTLTYAMGAKTTGNSFTGGDEIDVVRGVATAVSGDTLTASSNNAAKNSLTLQSGGTVDLSHVSNFDKIYLSSTAANTVTVSATTLNGTSDSLTPPVAVTIVDGNSGTTLTSSGVSGQELIFNAGTGLDTFTGGAEGDIVRVSAAAITLGDVLDGGAGDLNTLTMTTAGGTAIAPISLANVKNFGNFTVSAGTSFFTGITTNMFQGGALTINGLSGTSTITSTDATAGDILTLNAGLGTFTGDAEIDIVNIIAARVGSATLIGGSGTNTLNVTTTGTFNLAKDSHFGTINLTKGTNVVYATGAELNGTTVTATLPALAINHNTLVIQGAATTITGSKVTKGSTTLTLGANTLTTGDVYGVSGVGIAVGTTITAVTGLSQTMSNAATATTAVTGETVTAYLEIGTSDLSNVAAMSAISLANPGRAAITLSDTTLGGATGALTITDGGGVGNSVTSHGSLSSETLTYVAANSGDTFVGGAEADIVKVSAANLLGADHLTGGTNGTIAGAGNTLMVTTAGNFSLPFANVSGFGTIDLATGSSTVAVGATAYIGTAGSGVLTISDGASGNNVVLGGANSVGDTLTYNATTGADFFDGGSENDVVNVAAGKVGGDVLIGGAATDTLNLTNAGGFSLGGVIDFGRSFTLGTTPVGPTDGAINLFAGNNSVVVTTATLAGTLSGPAVTITAGATGANTISGRGAAGESLVYVAGGGTTTFYAGGESDTFVFTNTTALQTIAGFDPTADKLGFYNSAFGLSSGSTFANSVDVNTTLAYHGANTFNYNPNTGFLEFSTRGTTGTGTHIATLTNHASLATASEMSNVFFVS